MTLCQQNKIFKQRVYTLYNNILAIPYHHKRLHIRRDSNPHSLGLRLRNTCVIGCADKTAETSLTVILKRSLDLKNISYTQRRKRAEFYCTLKYSCYFYFPRKLYERKYTVRTEGIRITLYVIMREACHLLFGWRLIHVIHVNHIHTCIKVKVNSILLNHNDVDWFQFIKTTTINFRLHTCVRVFPCFIIIL